MSGKKGMGNVAGMRHRRKGGLAARPDGFDRSSADTLAARADEWFTYLEDRAYSANTLEASRWALRTFLAWAGERSLTHPHQITRPILESYQRHLARLKKPDGRPLGVTTQRGRLGALQRFFAWLCRSHVLPANPAADLELPRKRPRALRVHRITRLR